MSTDPLPNENQKRALSSLMYQAFVELRYFDGVQAHDLAYAFHNLPLELYGWGSWSVEAMRGRLQHYQSKHLGNLGYDYVKAFDEIFPR